MQQLASGGATSTRRRKYHLKEKRILTIIKKFDSGDYSLNEYINSLRGLAYICRPVGCAWHTGIYVNGRCIVVLYQKNSLSMRLGC